MTPSPARFALYIETGERAGARIEVPAGGLEVGRKPGSGLQLPDGSVSGRHARLEARDGGLVVRDLGSRNGTRVGGEKVEEGRLAHGDTVEFGAVRCTVLDAALEEAAPAGARGDQRAHGGDAATTALGSVSAERARAAAGGKRPLALVLLLVVVAAGAGAWWWLRGRGGEGPTRVRAVPEVPGNLVADGSFEDAEAALAWESAEEAPQAFRRDGYAAASGRLGLGVELEPGEWALARAPAKPLRARRSLALTATLTRAGGADVAAGIELARADGSRAPLLVFAEPLLAAEDAADATREVALALDALPGYDEARVFVAARAGAAAGSAGLDDVVLLEGEPRGGGAAFRDTTAWLPEPPLAVALVRVNDVVLAGRAVPADELGAAAERGPAWPAARLGARASENGIVLEVAPLAAAAAESAAPALVLDVRPGGAAADGDSVLAAAIGPSGFRASSSGLAGEPATALLFGRGIDLLRLGFGAALDASARPAAGGLAVVVPFLAAPAAGGAEEIHVQLDFREERVSAGRLADEARTAERRGEVGQALAAWTRLLDELPYEAALVAEAEAARSRLLQGGHAELDRVRRAHERALFFDLAEIHRENLAAARRIAADYAGSGVEERAHELAAEIEAALAELETTRDERAAALHAVLDVARASGWSRVAEVVGARLGEGAPEAAPAMDAPGTED